MHTIVPKTYTLTQFKLTKYSKCVFGEIFGLEKFQGNSWIGKVEKTSWKMEKNF